MKNEKYQNMVAVQAAMKHIKTDQVIGIGSVKIIEYFIKILKKRMINENLKILVVPTSFRSAILLMENQIPLTNLYENSELDVAVDGADEIDPNLNLIKGGSAFIQEKIVDSMAKKLIIIADESQKVEVLGKKTPVPIEIIPMALKSVMKELKAYSSEFKLRKVIKNYGPVITDNRNFIIDVKMTEIENPKQLELDLNGIPGVIDNGLIVEMADIVYFGSKEGLIKLKR